MISLIASFPFGFWLWLIAAGLTLGQQPRCLPLDDKTICGPAFKDASVLADIFPSLSMFNDYLTNTFANPEYAAASISEGSECQVSVGHVSRLRYQISYWCSRIVTESIQLGCPWGNNPSNITVDSTMIGIPPATNGNGSSIRLCSSSCGAARDTLISALSDPSVCSPGKPNIVTDPFRTFCSTAPSTDCLIAVPRELETCGMTNLSTCFVSHLTPSSGFRSAEIATKECSSSSDPCCKSLVEKLNRSKSKADANATVQSGAPSPVALGIAAGVCVFLIIVLFIVSTLLVRRYSRKEKNQGLPMHKSPDSSSGSSEASFYTRPNDPVLMYPSDTEKKLKQVPLSPIEEFPSSNQDTIKSTGSPASEKSFSEFHARPLNASSIYTEYSTTDQPLPNLRMDPNRESEISESRMYLASPTPPYAMMPNNPSYLIPPPPEDKVEERV